MCYCRKDSEEHSKLHGSFQCEFCDVVKSFASDLAEHELEHNSKSPSKSIGDVNGSGDKSTWDCPRCPLSFSSKDPFILHHLSVHLSLPVIDDSQERCMICYMRPHKKHLLQHYIISHNLKECCMGSTLKCRMEDCPAYFTTLTGLTNHYKLIHDCNKHHVKLLEQQRLTCRDCGKCFPTGYDLRTHRLKIHVSAGKAIPCTYENCKTTFETKAELDMHTSNLHATEETKLECEKCKKPIWKRSLSRHMKGHKRQEDIQAGLLMAREVPLYVCDVCGKGFKFRNVLSTHHLSHSGPSRWEFMCSVCSKKCMTQQKLDEHLRTHSKEKPFVCELCGEKYAHKHNLRNHVNSKHKDKLMDVPRKYDRINLPSKKGIKRKQTRDEGTKNDSDAN